MRKCVCISVCIYIYTHTRLDIYILYNIYLSIFPGSPERGISEDIRGILEDVPGGIPSEKMYFCSVWRFSETAALKSHLTMENIAGHSVNMWEGVEELRQK